MKKIYVGTCGQVMAWKKLLTSYSALEINSTFYRFPSERQIKNWSQLFRARGDFFLSLKAYQGFTHPRRSPTWKRSGLSKEELDQIKDYVGCLKWNKYIASFWQDTLELIEKLQADFLLFQLPKFCEKESANIYKFFQTIDLSRLKYVGLEIRWEDQNLLTDLEERYKIVPVFDPFLEPELRENFFPKLEFLYLRLHGTKNPQGRLNYNYRYSQEELNILKDWLKAAQAKTICVLFNNSYMKEDALRFEELLREAKP